MFDLSDSTAPDRLAHHQLRNALHAVLGWLELAEDASRGESAHQFVREAIASAHSLEQIIVSVSIAELD